MLKGFGRFSNILVLFPNIHVPKLPLNNLFRLLFHFLVSNPPTKYHLNYRDVLSQIFYAKFGPMNFWGKKVNNNEFLLDIIKVIIALKQLVNGSFKR